MDLTRPLTVVTPTVDADVLAVLAGAAASFTGRQVHQVTGRHSESGVRAALDRLRQHGIVTRERAGNSYLYQLNRDHLAASHIEAMARLRTELFNRIATELGTWETQPRFVALFGSAARGDMQPDSDLDLFVVRPDDVDPDNEYWRGRLAGLSHHITGWTGNDCRVLELAAQEVRTEQARGSRVLDDIRSTGIALHGPSHYLHLTGRHG